MEHVLKIIKYILPKTKHIPLDMINLLRRYTSLYSAGIV